MAGGYPLVVNNIPILTSEALYQACRYPGLPEVQEKIIAERSPMSAKMVGKPHRSETRSDWDKVRTKIMYWCLRVKLAQNFVQFGQLLETTTDRPIVEESRKDKFWGTVRSKGNPNELAGTNALGRLLMKLRQEYHEEPHPRALLCVDPLDIPDFNLYGKPIGRIDARGDLSAKNSSLHKS